jgi:Fe-S-cluster containining protein
MDRKILTCDSCDAECCKYVAIEIDTPENLEDFENIRWYVAHKNVHVYVEEDGTWNVEFLTPCEHLSKNNRCMIREKRPQICREYHQGECTFHNDYKEVFSFGSIEDVDKYIEEIFKKELHVIPEEEDEN